MVYAEFKKECAEEIEAQGEDEEFVKLSRGWMDRSHRHKYSYHFEWMGRPIIQYPQDIVIMQELIWTIKPDLIIETGIAHGGSLIFSASMLELLATCGGPTDGKVVGVDIDIRKHNREAIEAHPMFKRITMIEGSSIAEDIVERVKEEAAGRKRILVCLDSNHFHDHVLGELTAYAPLVSVGSYCVVFDTVIEYTEFGLIPNRPWVAGNSPATAVTEYLKTHPEFEVDTSLDRKAMISVVPGGYLRRTR